MHIHILGICGTFMGGIAAIAKQLGYHVTGSDLNVYPPMSTQLESLGIELTQGWDESQFQPEPDIVIIGNAMSRGNPAVEYVLNRNIPYQSGPEWLKHHLLKDRWVIAASGTHGKTTTSSMVAWILEDAGFDPGYLIGGVPGNFDVSARAGSSPFFVIEADEYDTAFFDKRSKFVHYLPKTLIVNNLEFDHADIFADLKAIQTQFHHLIRTVPSTGLILTPNNENNIDTMLNMGSWSEQQRVGKNGEWHAALLPNELGNLDGSRFQVIHHGEEQGTVQWSLTGQHNVNNALMAIAAAHHAGILIAQAIDSLSKFKTPKRRMELLSNAHDVYVYDDFAHHPTAIDTTLSGLRAKIGNKRLVAILEPRSNTMKMGVHKDTLAASWQQADVVMLLQEPSLCWKLDQKSVAIKAQVFHQIEEIIQSTIDLVQPGDHIVVMSNGGFGGIHQKLIDAIAAKLSS
jgi:UDP-N-acetylmuramate: L-alanyl-gamma-D-glutamyl-meso-diaminopimelate ligase